jgi:hypothetical protein
MSPQWRPPEPGAEAVGSRAPALRPKALGDMPEDERQGRLGALSDRRGPVTHQGALFLGV